MSKIASPFNTPAASSTSPAPSPAFSSASSMPGVKSLHLSPAEQALKDRIEQFNQLPEVSGEELVNKYLDVHTTAAAIQSAVGMAKGDAESNSVDSNTKQLMASKIKTASRHLVDQASDFLSSCHDYKKQSNISINPNNS
ncbi:hypothetical protein KJ707_01600 [Patescibacteria group bacterium]|nr:hypothetical protein [Patescibacteria group bacterium]